MTSPQDTKTIHCYDFPSFAIELEKAIKEGYSLDLHTIAHYPQQLGFQYITTVVKQDSNVVQKNTEVKLTLEVDTTEVQKVVAEALAQVEAAQEAPATPVVEAPAEAPKKPAGRPAKGK